MALVNIDNSVINTEHILKIGEISGDPYGIYSQFTFTIVFIHNGKSDFMTKTLSAEGVWRARALDEDTGSTFAALADERKKHYASIAYALVVERREKLINLWKGNRPYEII